MKTNEIYHLQTFIGEYLIFRNKTGYSTLVTQLTTSMKRTILLLLGLIPAVLLGQSISPLEKELVKTFDNKDSADYYFASAWKMLKTRSDTASYLYFKFYRADEERDDDSANYYAERVIPMYSEVDSLERLRKIYARLYYQKLRHGSYENAIDFANKALELATRLKDTSMMAFHTSDKSIAYHDFEDYETGVEYGKRAFNLMANAKNIDYRQLIFANNAIAINFDDWGKADSALFYHYKNLKYLKKVEDSTRFAFIFNNIGNTNLKQGNYQVAYKMVQRALAMNKSKNKVYNLATNYTNLATIAYEQGDYNLAKENFKEAYHYAEESASIEKIRDVVQQEAWFYKQIRDYEKALERQEAFYVLRDSVFNKERAESVAEIETKYQTEKKEKELAETRADLAETELEVKQKNTMIYGSLGLAVVLGLLGYLFYNQQKLKNRQLQKESELKTALARIETQNRLQEQRLRISRDLHDNIGSQLTFIISSVDNLKFKLKEAGEAVTDKLSNISDFTGQTIYELRDTIWAMNKSKITLEDLQSRISNFIEKAGASSNGTSFSFAVSEGISEETEFTSVQGMNLYRIIQEAVNNALKYSEATEIEVGIDKNDEQYLLKIHDNGKGFNENETEAGNGLANIRKRARDLGGQAEIVSKLGDGTSVTVSFES